MIREFQRDDINKVADIWLDTNIKAHNFIPAEYWKSNFKSVKEALLLAEVYVYEYDTEIQGFIGLNDEYVEGIFVSGEMQSQDMVEQLLTDNNRVRKHGSGVGVINVHNRIRLRFGKPYGLEIESMPDEGTTIRIHLPYIPYEPEKLELLENGKMQELKGGKSNEEK